jgi:ketosteroid isomerase-like protein
LRRTNLSLSALCGFFFATGFVTAAAQSSHLPGNLALSGESKAFAELRQQWVRNLHDKNIAASVAEYAPDAEFIQPDGSRVRGAAAIRKLYETITSTFDSALVFDSQRVDLSGNLAYDSGTYRETLIVRASGKPQLSAGSYLTVYHRNAAGAWLIVEQAWTGSIQ